MTDIVTPPLIDELPPAPLPGEDRPTFDAKAFPLVAALEPMREQMNASAENVHQNATAANERAVSADGFKTAAAGSATAAAGSATAAAGSATAASGSATAAAGSATTAVNARDAAISARDTAVPAASAAVTARNEAEGFRDQARDYATEQLIATSTTILTPGAGNKNFTIQTNKAFVVGMYLVATSSGTPADYMSGTVVTYNAGTGALVLSVDSYSGSTARTDWVIGIGSKGGVGSSPTSGPSSTTLYRTGGVLDSVAFVQDGKNGAIYLTRSGGRLTQVVTTFDGKTRTETLNYTGDVLTSVTATET